MEQPTQPTVGIESSFETIKDFLAWTKWQDSVNRLFHFGFAIMLYDMWLWSICSAS